MLIGRSKALNFNDFRWSLRQGFYLYFCPMPQQQTSSNAILRSWRGLLAARPRIKPGVSVPLGIPGRLLREFAQQLVVLCHDLFCHRHLGLKLPAAWQ